MTSTQARRLGSDDTVFAAFPDVRLDHENVAFYRGLLEHRYLVNRCQACKRWSMPPRRYCPDCWADGCVPTEISGRGFVFAFTVLHQGRPMPGVTYPYPLGIIELAEQRGLRISAPIVGASHEDIRIGAPATLTWVERAGVPCPAFLLDEVSER